MLINTFIALEFKVYTLLSHTYIFYRSRLSKSKNDAPHKFKLPK